MSALGHKQTLSDISGMSALPPKADIAERDAMSAFGHKRTSRHFRIMSALPPKADIQQCPGRRLLYPRKRTLRSCKGHVSLAL